MIVYPFSLIIISRNPLEKLQAGTWIFYSILAVLTGSLSTPGTMFSCCYSDNAYIKAHLKESLNPRKDELTCRTGHDNNNVLEDIVASKHLLVPFRKQISFALINIFPFFFMFSFFFFFFCGVWAKKKNDGQNRSLLLDCIVCDECMQWLHRSTSELVSSTMQIAGESFLSGRSPVNCNYKILLTDAILRHHFKELCFQHFIWFI